MANYSQMLGKLAAEKASGAVKGIAGGAKRAFFSEAEGIQAAASLVQVSKEQINVANKTLVEQRKNNVISIEMVKELKRVNSNIARSNVYNTSTNAPATTGAPTTPEGRMEAGGGVNFGIPMAGKFTVTSRYGMRNGKMHSGIDLQSADKKGTVIASAEGVVVETRNSPSYGTFIKIKHSNGFHTFYGHLSQTSVFQGRKVKAGEAIGVEGNTGTVDGPTGIHLHFEVHNKSGQRIDPESVIDFGQLGPKSDSTTPDAQGNQYAKGSVPSVGVPSVGGSLSGVLSGFRTGTAAAAAASASPTARPLGSGTTISTDDPTEIARITARAALRTTQLQAETVKQLKIGNSITSRGLGVSVAGISAGGTAKRGPPTQDQLRERYYRSQLESARQSFLGVTQRLINTTLLKTFFPRGFGVTRQQSLGMGYVGNLIGNEIGLTNKITGVLSKAFGKQYGQAYGQIFGRLGNVFIDKAANEFSKSIGFNPEDPTQFTFGQILGNFLTKGTKEQRKAGRRMGLEQLVYNYTGIPLGPSSLLSFLSMNPAMAGFRSLMGMTGNPMQYAMNPAMALQQMSGAGAMYMTNPLFGATGGGFNMIPGMSIQQQRQAMMLQTSTNYNGQRMTMDSAAVARASAEEAAEGVAAQKGFFESLGDTFTGGFRSLMGVFGFGGGPGGGTMMGGGGGPSGGGFLDNLMYAGGNLATMYLGGKLFGKTGLGKSQNPLVQIVGSMAMNYLVKSGFQIAANALGFGDIAGKFLGANTGLADLGGAFLGTLTGASTAGITAGTLGELGINTALSVGSTGGPASVVAGVTGSAPIVTAGGTTVGAAGGTTVGAAGGTTVGAAGGTTAATTAASEAAASGVLSGTVGATTAATTAAGEAAALAGEAAASGVLSGTVGATTAATTGTTAAVGAETAAAATASEGIIAIAAEAIPIIAAVYAVYKIFDYFLFEKGDTRATYSIYVKGNNDINAGGIVHAEKTGESHFKFVEQFGKAGFAMIKKLESQGVKPDFDYFTLQINFNPHRRVEIGFNNGTPGKGDRKNTPIKLTPFDLRKEIDAAVIKAVMDDLAKAIAERMSQASAKSQTELQSTLNTLTKTEAEGNFEGLDKNVYKDQYGNTSFNEAIAARATAETVAVASGDTMIGETTGNMSVFNAKTGQYQIVSGESGILGYDVNGNPITRASLNVTKSASAAPAASGTNLTYNQVQQQNDELKNSNPTTAAAAGGSGSNAIVNAGNVVDNSNKTTIINQSLYDSEVIKYGAYSRAEFSLSPTL
ncbi:M23 family metallopeptidase [bacterium]|nr:M23 family metallopeptidase [bacterium]